MKTEQYIGKDNLLRQVIDGDTYILDNVYHYKHTAVKEASQYLMPTKVRIVKIGGSKGCYGIWMKEEQKPDEPRGEISNRLKPVGMDELIWQRKIYS